MSRHAEIERATVETRIRVTLDLDGDGRADVRTGVAFYDHLLAALARFAGFSLAVRAEGDLAVDPHHTVEDVAIVLGQAFRAALGDAAGIARFASLHLPMDEALVCIALDVSGRPYLHADLAFPQDRVGDLPVELVEEALRAFTTHAAVTLHVDQVRGRNSHHVAEAVFKGLGVALGRAVAVVGRGVPSTKGVL
ncbi:MAG: imidazoleglycerol-phosphate dehydratase HisB [Armatimonadota bacterium]|nr:imidazoleglycerol-phosphate dehydratase HisB [Armatimonadota bacterium]MDR7532857.1 imidazoleglycerol-phosphate dehydratase HisB [Armatimonadota bacterium]MDR7535139.1 imidazoleglycerol-phosphate dehydratase HisB [Armatimonadota bacterium]